MTSLTSPPRRTVFGRPLGQALAVITIGVLLAALFVTTSLAIASQSVSERNARLLRLATAPDVRVSPFSGEGGIRGAVYERPGQPTMLVVVTGLPPLGRDERYEMWFLRGGRIYENQHVRPDREGAARIALDLAEPGFYDEVTITREHEQFRLPTGPVVARWTRR
ncbi:MAG: anti-sigma factor [Chloroflexi bacterium]|nr:anti-sigma factor [Chloroflexota bacterium]